MTGARIHFKERVKDGALSWCHLICDGIKQALFCLLDTDQRSGDSQGIGNGTHENPKAVGWGWLLFPPNQCEYASLLPVVVGATKAESHPSSCRASPGCTAQTGLGSRALTQVGPPLRAEGWGCWGWGPFSQGLGMQTQAFIFPFSMTVVIPG